jgi:hypothetical protein
VTGLIIGTRFQGNIPEDRIKVPGKLFKNGGHR